MSEPPRFTGQQINLFCADVERSLEFYRRLGFAERFRTPKTGPAEHLEVDGPATRIGLTSAQLANTEYALAVEPGRNSGELVLWCENADAAFAAALDAGATVHRPPAESPDGRLRYGWVLDPAGHQVKFVQEL